MDMFCQYGLWICMDMYGYVWICMDIHCQYGPMHAPNKCTVGLQTDGLTDLVSHIIQNS